MWERCLVRYGTHLYDIRHELFLTINVCSLNIYQANWLEIFVETLQTNFTCTSAKEKNIYTKHNSSNVIQMFQEQVVYIFLCFCQENWKQFSRNSDFLLEVNRFVLDLKM